MSKYRKKPVEIEARLVTHETANEVAAWCGGTPGWAKFAAPGEEIMTPDSFTGIDIATLEGVMHASPGDWVIRGVSGEFYPCKPDIFAATYEPVDEPEHVHEIVVTHDRDTVTYKAVCHAPEGAGCRLTCDEGCESWLIERDETGPYHLVDTLGDPIRHPLRDRGECSVAEWLNLDGFPVELGEGTFEVGRFPIVPVWDVDGCTWKHAQAEVRA